MVKNLQNEDLCKIGVKLAAHIDADQAVNTYCEANFGKKLTVYVGMLGALLAGTDSEPYIAIHDFAKVEGAGTSKAMYACIIAVSIQTDEECADYGPNVVVSAQHQRLSELMSLIQDSLNTYKGGCQPPTSVETIVAGPQGDNLNQWTGFIAPTWEISLPLGGKIPF